MSICNWIKKFFKCSCKTEEKQPMESNEADMQKDQNVQNDFSENERDANAAQSNSNTEENREM
ncbi:MAG: hypothetical protein V1768_00445 [Patescibacteria group bacterium]|nr:hypothetical protein [Patescibacteria group bacterium]MBU1349973.1 hypothetical protein [Patescibacteria group bacterium]MBU1421010.1 hypothetical protein [Patescibacteria group bacterium]MBU1684555.1 hypothetical protein [Patescibacteria group bacterium]MBU1778385.1 hypothetical protein [Patescibacteria group bacterium]